MAKTDIPASTPDADLEVMTNGLSHTLRQIRNSRIQGRWEEAVIGLEEVIARLGPDINLTLELGDTLFAQGFFARASQSLEKHMAANSVQTHPAFTAAQLIRLFAQFYITAQFQVPLSQAEMIYAEFLSGPHDETVNDATVRIETYYCKFHHLAARCGLFDDALVRNKLLPRLQKKFYVSLHRGDFFNALSIARTYNVCFDGPEKTSLVEILALSEHAPLLYQAHAWFIIAKALTADDQKPKQTDLYTRARKIFQDTNHAHGVLDTNIAMACRLPFDPAASGVNEDLADMFKNYRLLNYPTGYADALLSLLHIYHDLHNSRQEFSIVNELESLFPASTSKLSWLMLQVSTLALHAANVIDSGKVIQGGEALWNELVDSDCKFLRGQAALHVSHAYRILKYQDKTTLWSQRAQKDLACTNLAPTPSLVEDFDLSTYDGLTSCYTMVLSLVNPTSSGYLPESAIETIETFLNQILVCANLDQRSFDVIEAVIKTYEENFSRLTDRTRAPLILAKLRQSQANLLTMRASFRQDIELELAALGPAKEARDSYLEAKELRQAIMALQREALLNLAIAQKFQRSRDLQEQLAWETATNQFRVASESADQLGFAHLARECAYWVAYCQYRQWLTDPCSSEILLKSLHVADGFVDQQRQELSILRRMAAAVAKGRLSANEHNRSIYRIAIKVCNRTGNPLDAWNWVQRSKARSLSDMLGLGIFVPHELTMKIYEDETCRSLFQTEQRLAEQLSASRDTERLKLTANLEDHQKLMRKEAALVELLDMRAGTPITMNDLIANSTNAHVESRCEKATLFVDWVTCEGGLLLYVVKQGELPIMRELPISIDEIREWASQYLKDSDGAVLTGMLEEDEFDEGPLRAMDALIAPLIELSSADDLLVLCPTNILHAIPLHALRLGSGYDKKMLIERNPVVYCASLTSFVQCCRRANKDITTMGKVENRILAVYEPEFEIDDNYAKQFSNDERRQIYESANCLASVTNGESLCGAQVSIQSFKDSLERAGILHFVGHCDYVGELIAQQSLRLFGEELDDHGEPRPTILAVKDLFDLSVNISHVSLLACASATQKFELGDEPLGLVTAFLSAGATSVLGTIWPVQSSAARLFSEYFYRYLASSSQDDSKVYDLAYATREAVLDLKQHWEFRQPYYWAPFVLHGAWFIRGDLGLAKT